MAHLLLVDDDPQQLELRKLVLEGAGHTVHCAAGGAQAVAAMAAQPPRVLVMDLRIPDAESGRALIRESRGKAPDTSIVVLSGYPADLNDTPEKDMVDQIVRKPVRSRNLLQILSRLAILIVLAGGIARAQNSFPFQVDSAAEVVAEIEMSGPGTDWGRAGREAVMAVATLDDARKQNIMLHWGGDARKYTVLLGPVEPGSHQLRIERHPDYSAKGTTLRVGGVTFRIYKPADPDYAVIANAPYLHARPNTIGKFTDVPLLTYCERLGDGSLRYSVIFSNEDGGTSTRALMARWGRVTDIEHVYQIWPDPKNKRTLIQTRDHKDVPFRGKYEGGHPLLGIVTDNNMVDEVGTSAVRYQQAPIVVTLTNTSREQVMDDYPETYVISARELERESKLRKFGTVEGTKISQPENYLFTEFRVFNKDSRVAVWVRLEGENLWRSSNLGTLDMAIERSGWVRSAVELPPATQPPQIAEIGFQCIADRTSDGSGSCRVEAIGKLFLLEQGQKPGRSFWRPRNDAGPWVIQPGNMRSIALR